MDEQTQKVGWMERYIPWMIASTLGGGLDAVFVLSSIHRSRLVFFEHVCV